jgi:CrcB protein
MTSPAVLVGLGGILGALARHMVGSRIETENADTFGVNVLGSFALGVFTTAPLDAGLAFVFATGFCGAFTTFSTFAFETVRLFDSDYCRSVPGRPHD